MIKLTDTEWKIMELLWDKGPMPTMELIRELKDSMGWAKSTAMTFLGRMTSKGSITYSLDGKSRKYFANISRDEAELEETRSFLSKIYGGNVGLMINSMLKQEALTKEDIEEIERIIKDGE